QKPRGPIRQPAVRDGITVAVRRNRRDPQAHASVIAQALQSSEVETKLSIRKLATQLVDEFSFQAGQSKMRYARRQFPLRIVNRFGQPDTAFGQESLRSTQDVRTNRLPHFLQPERGR